VYTTLGPYREDMQDVGPLAYKVPGLRIFTAGSPWAQIDDRLEVRPEDYVVWKKWQSSFHGTDLATILVHRRIDTVVVTGCVTSGCVRATVVDACTHGFRVIIPRECVGDRTAEIHEANLFDMNAKNADVIPTAEAQAYFGARAGSQAPSPHAVRA
jgi:nicotinamidase-related amidase